MKANEMMLDDWVHGLSPDGKLCVPCRISAVDIYPTNRTPRIVTHGGYGYQEENLRPIFLTAEILEKNGFERKHPESEKRAYWILRTATGEVKAKRNRGFFYFDMYGTPMLEGLFSPHFSGHLAFVHELQHALKFCRIEKNIVL